MIHTHDNLSGEKVSLLKEKYHVCVCVCIAQKAGVLENSTFYKICVLLVEENEVQGGAGPSGAMANTHSIRTCIQASCAPPEPTLCISKGVGSSTSCISSEEACISWFLLQGRWPGLPSRATFCTVPVMMDACRDTALHSDASRSVCGQHLWTPTVCQPSRSQW